MDIDVLHYARVLLKRKWILLATLLVSLALGALITVRTKPVYLAESTLFVGQRQVSTELLTQGVQLTALSEKLLRSYAQVLTSRSIAEKAVRSDGLGVAPVTLARRIRAEPVGDTQIIRLSYRSSDPDEAARAVNLVAQAFVDEIGRIDQLEGQAAVQVSIIDPALRPNAPFYPIPARNMALAGALGLAAGFGLALLVEQLDRSVRSREEVEDLLGLPVLTSAPELSGPLAGGVLDRDLHSADAEAFRKLRAAIRFLEASEPIRVLMVTSPFAREGKTTIALNLAVAYARGGQDTVLVEADLRRPTLHDMFPGTRRGLSMALAGRATAEQATSPTGVRGLSVMLAGPLPPNPVELIASKRMDEVVAELTGKFDRVVIDTPPILPVTEASSLASRVDGVVLVARLGSTPRDRLVEAAKLAANAGGRVLGVVCNFSRGQEARYDYSSNYAQPPFEPLEPAETEPGRSGG